MRGELGAEASADHLRRRVRCDQLRPALLELLQPAEQLVELGVGHGGGVEHVVTELVTAHGLDKLAVLGSHLARWFGHHARPCSRSSVPVLDPASRSLVITQGRLAPDPDSWPTARERRTGRGGG